MNPKRLTHQPAPGASVGACMAWRRPRQQAPTEWLGWRQLFRSAAETGVSTLFQALQRADEHWPKPVDKDWLKAVLELVPEVHAEVSPEAAEHLLRQCLKWARPLPLDDGLALLDHFQMACRSAPLSVEDGLKAALMRLLGWDLSRAETRIRLGMAHPNPGLERLALASPGLDETQPAAPVFPFMQLPKDVRLAVLRWLIPVPTSASDLAWADRRGQELMSVCHRLTSDVLPLLPDRAPGYWRHGARLQASPAIAVDNFLALLGNSEPCDYVVSESKRLACAICLLPEPGLVQAALQALFTGVHQRGMAWLVPHLAETCARVLCLAHPDREGGHLLQLLTGLRACAGPDAFQRHCVAHLRVYIDTQQPDCSVLMPDKEVTPAHAAYRCLLAFLEELPCLSDVERFHRVRDVDAAFCNTGTPDSLSSVLLIASVHALSESEDGPLLHAPAWWNFAAQRVKVLLNSLNTLWPSDTPLPHAALFRCIPLSLLRRAFHQLEPTARAALLQRPLAFTRDGCCLQLPLLCDFFLDERIPESERLALLAWCQRSAPLSAQLQAVAWDPAALSASPLPERGDQAEDGGEQFLRECWQLRERWLRTAATLASKVRDVQALLSRANGPEDFFLGLWLIDDGLPKPVDIHLLHWVLDRIPMVCRDDPQAVRRLLRHSFIAAALGLSNGERHELLWRFRRACELLPVETAVRMWTALVGAVREHKALVDALWAPMESHHDSLLRQLFEDCQKRPAEEAWRHWKAATAGIDANSMSMLYGKQFKAMDEHLRPLVADEAEAARGSRREGI